MIVAANKREDLLSDLSPLAFLVLRDLGFRW